MDQTDFVRAAYNPGLRSELFQALTGDSVLLARAKAEVQKLAEQHQRGQIFDRDHTSRITHEMLSKMLQQVEAAKQPIEVKP
jgi:hypothetical protein